DDTASHYTTIALNACKTVDKAKAGEGEWTVWSCPGRAGYLVRVTVEDLRMTVSAGRTVAAAAQEPAAGQGFPSFNKATDTIEWRESGGAPFALIQRWLLTDPLKLEDANAAVGLLVVTRLPPGPVCHVAYVDVRANRDANVLARQAADEVARGF